MPGPRHIDLWWRRSDLGALLFLCIAAAAALGWAIGQGRIEFAHRPPAKPEQTKAARERIDPNTASEASLLRLPGIGKVRAAAITAYRASRGDRAFKFAEDLGQVRGIGPAIAQRIAQHLVLPSRGD